MKKSLFALVALLIALPALAEVTTGFYRIKNYKSNRYAYMLDDKAIKDMAGGSIDVSAIELWKNLDRALADPSTIIYMEKIGSDYDISAQGTSVYSMTGLYLKLRDASIENAYHAYGTLKGMSKYLGDYTQNRIDEHSYLCDNGIGDYKLWNFEPLNNDTDNYFGIQSTVSGNNGDFTTLYMGFDLTLSNPETKAYAISLVDSERGYAVYEPIEGTIPAKVPVIIKTVGSNPADNKAFPALATSTNKPQNKLGGVFFQNTRTNHKNFLEYDASSMRVLGVLSDGSVGFVNETSRQYVDRNKAYLKVEANCPDEVKLVTKDEYEVIIAGIADITNDQQAVRVNGRTIEILKPASQVAVYNLVGAKIHSGYAKSIVLPVPGIYLITVDSRSYKLQVK